MATPGTWGVLNFGSGALALMPGSSLLLSFEALGVYSGGGQGHIGQINGITFSGNFPPAMPYGTAIIDIGEYFTSSPNSQSIMGINSALAVQGTTNNVFAVCGQLATPTAYTGTIGPGQLLCGYFENDHNGSGECAQSYGCSGYSYQQGAGTINISKGGYFESCSGFYYASTGGINENFGIHVKSGGKSGTIPTDITVFIDVPYTGATFTSSPHKGLVIADQTAGGTIVAFALQIQGSGAYCDFGGNILTFGNTNVGFSYVSPSVLQLGNGSANAIGTLMLEKVQLTTSSSAPTSASTAGTVGQIIAHGALVYYCSVTGAAGLATWNNINLTPV